MRFKLTGSLLGLAALAAAPASAQVIINEVFPNPGSEFDGSEYIELHNPTGGPVNITGWVIATPEFAGTCGGDHFFAFPAVAASTIPAGGYIVVAKDNLDAGSSEQDGFNPRFGFDADFEMYDADRTFEFDDVSVPNMTLISANDPGNDTQIRLIPGNGYGATCNTVFNQAEVVYLWNGTPPSQGGIGVLVDVIEYGDPTNCVTDPCLGVGSSDNDQFQGLPGVGESLGRDASSSDTGNSSNDLALGTPTPNAQNIPNPGPLLSGLSANPAGPTAGQSADVTITATDVDGIASMYVVYTVNGGAADSVAMSLAGPDLYTGTIPGQLDNDQVAYFVRATDSGSPAGVSRFPDFGTRAIRWGTQTIFAVQFHSPPSDTGQSAEVGNVVNIEGVVTAEPGLYNDAIFTIQSAAGFWNGVHCFDNFFEVQVNRGDMVRVTGTVEEYFEKTEVTFFGQADVQVLSSGNPLPGPNVLGAGTLTTGTATGELWEGCYVRVEDVAVTNDALGFGEWEITDGTGSCRVDDYAFYNYLPTNGDSLTAVQGIVEYSFSDRKIEPRDDGDIIGPPIVSTVRYSPICPTSAGPVTVSCVITDDGSLPRKKLFFSTDNGATYDSVDVVSTGGDGYAAAIGPYADGTEIDYHVEVTDDTGFDGRSPATGDYDFYVGVVSIETIQSTYIAGSDSSAFEGSPRNCAGIVTMAPGVLADNIFAMQNNWVSDPANRGIIVFTGGSVVGLIDEGDSVCVSGDVDEFFGNTQIRLHFSDAYTNFGFVGLLPAYELLTTDLPPDDIGAVPASEVWESVLVRMNGSVVTNASAGFGQYNIDNTAPKNGQETLVDDEARFAGLTYSPTLNDSISVAGIVDFSFDEYKIQPRGDYDILPYDPADAVGVDPAGSALAFALHQNSPNPVGGAVTRISFAVPRATSASLRVFDVTGRLVKTLLNGPVEAGVHTLDWNGRNTGDHEVAAGVYFYRLQADGREATRKMVMLR
ncbi:MAG TPA: lamin tail domain-containing protein [bacterium]|nr:lamin tail domain-containing protein [bacterium]